MSALDTSERAALDWWRSMHPGVKCRVETIRESGCTSVVICSMPEPHESIAHPSPYQSRKLREARILATMEEAMEAWSEAFDAYRNRTEVGP